jgi:uncharacterized protein (TIGR02646 family)
MKPVKKDPDFRRYSPYDKAKPELLKALGEHCSYCERPGAPQDLHVEHIYPKDPHPAHEELWDNFLLACNTCNSCKHAYQGSGRQRNLYGRFVWPHRENTYRAFSYKASGAVEIAAAVPVGLVSVVERTREMVGLLVSPAKAATYQKLGIAYDGAKRRSQMWNMAEGFRTMYLTKPIPADAAVIANGAARLGYFSVWMEVFHDRREMRRELIRAFNADPACFNAATQPIPKGRL